MTCITFKERQTNGSLFIRLSLKAKNIAMQKEGV